MALGSARIYHAKGARTAYASAMRQFSRAIENAEAGSCSRAHDELTVANQDFGSFFTEFKHAVGASQYSLGPMGAPRMRQALRNKMSKARDIFARKCMIG